MNTIDDYFGAGQIGLTVYTPDVMHSQLWGHLDQRIHDATKLVPVYRQWIVHDYNSIMRFYTESGDPPQVDDPIAQARKYDEVPIEELQYGHLVVKHLLSAPSLLTLWRGENAITTLLEIKGATHPAKAKRGSLRASFWTDNAVLNLVHSSDSISELKRELIAIDQIDALQEEMQPLMLLSPRQITPTSLVHSGIIVLYHLVHRMLMGQSVVQSLQVDFPQSDDAADTVTLYADALTTFLPSLTDNFLADFVTAYLAGDVITVSNHLTHLPATQWEKFVLQCGAINRDEWLESIQ